MIAWFMTWEQVPLHRTGHHQGIFVIDDESCVSSIGGPIAVCGDSTLVRIEEMLMKKRAYLPAGSPRTVFRGCPSRAEISGLAACCGFVPLMCLSTCFYGSRLANCTQPRFYSGLGWAQRRYSWFMLCGYSWGAQPVVAICGHMCLQVQVRSFKVPATQAEDQLLDHDFAQGNPAGGRRKS